MKMKMGSITAGVMAAIVTAAGCGNNETYEYGVSGTVEARQIDYDCPDAFSMEAVGYVAGRGGGSKSKSRSPKNRPPAKKSNPRSGPNSGVDRPRVQGPTQGGSGQAPKSQPRVKSDASLTKKPSKPKKLAKMPELNRSFSSEGCETEYELFIRSNGELFEQEVRQVDHDNCTETSQFPACVTGERISP